MNKIIQFAVLALAWSLPADAFAPAHSASRCVGTAVMSSYLDEISHLKVNGAMQTNGVHQPVTKEMLSGVLQEAERRAHEAEQRVAQLQQDLFRQHEAQQSFISKLQEELRQETKELQERVKYFADAFQQLKLESHATITKLTREKETLASEISTLKIDLEAATKAANAERAKNEEMQEKLAELTKELGQVKVRYSMELVEMEDRFEKEQDALFKEKLKSTADISELQDQIYKGVWKAKAEGRKQAENVRIDLTTKLAHKDAIIKDTLHNLQSAQSEVLALQTQVDALNEERMSLRRLTGQTVSVVMKRLQTLIRFVGRNQKETMDIEHTTLAAATRAAYVPPPSMAEEDDEPEEVVVSVSVDAFAEKN